MKRLCLLLGIILAFAACQRVENRPETTVRIALDGEQLELTVSDPLRIDQLLAREGITLSALDRVSHPLATQLTDGMLITIRRVRTEETCLQRELPFERELQLREGMSPSLRRLQQAGATGLQEACYRVLFEDGQELERSLLSTPQVLATPRSEIILTGPQQRSPAISIPGRLSYINHAQIWTMQGNTEHKERLATDQPLDGLAFHQSHDGAYILFSSPAEDSEEFINELWLRSTRLGAAALRLRPSDVLYAQWQPGTQLIAYTTGERSEGTPGWSALNNLWLMQIDPRTGNILSIREALPEATGGYTDRWGGHFAWSPLGDTVAVASSRAISLVDFAQKRRLPLVEFAPLQPQGDWLWHSSISWSPDGRLLAIVSPGAPQGNAAHSAAALRILSAEGRFSADLVNGVGMWAQPAFSPWIDGTQSGYLAWLQAREPHASISSGYDLLLADRDGSNVRHLFPPMDEPGLQKQDVASKHRDFAWSPDAHFIAIAYQGNLWLLEVATAAAQQLTFDGASSHPVWTAA